jgi:hypothetical protein
MSLKSLFVISAALAILFGLGFLLLPSQVLALYGGRPPEEIGAETERPGGRAEMRP